jgi:hypothetical protein
MSRAAVAPQDGTGTVALLRRSAFSRERTTTSLVGFVIREGAVDLQRCRKPVPIAISAVTIGPAIDNGRDIDAILGAITAAARIGAVVAEDEFEMERPMPKGFRIPKRLSFDRHTTTNGNFGNWTATREASA